VTGYDGYDNYGEYAEAPSYDPAPPVHVGAHAAGGNDIEALIHLAIDIVNQAKPLPMSTSIRISRDELLDVLESALRVLPEEIREARWALRDREELMAAEMRKADQLREQVRAEAARMVDKTEIVRQARIRADQIIVEAEERARKLINEYEDFCDHKLGEMEIFLDRTTRMVQSGRERLRPNIVPPLAPPPGEDGGEGAASFFDQDVH
jgi:hypothetical protein